MTTVPDLTHAVWRKASLSESAQGCVEVAILDTGLVAVRDSKDLLKPAHLYPVSDWMRFLEGLRSGRLSTGTRIAADITADGVLLTDALNAAAPHHYSHLEWLCFLDGVLKHEPQLTAAGS